AGVAGRRRRAVPAAPGRGRRGVDARGGRALGLGRRGTRDGARALAGRRDGVVASARRGLRAATTRLDGTDARLRALDPRRVLERGYTITRDERGALVRAAAQVPTGPVPTAETAAG